MADIFDYLTWRGDLPLESSPFCEVDGVILARLSYLPFEYAAEGGAALTIAGSSQRLLAVPDIDEKVLRKEDTHLLDAVGGSIRFGAMKLFGYINQIDGETQTQFSAIGIRLGEGRYCVAFRGTDNTLVGWKEDLNMGCVCPVPAQKMAVRYLEHIAAQVDGRIIVCGHSKGGNLAVYAASFCGPEVQKRIETVYNFDGPGFDETVLLSEGYKNICDKTETFVPQASIVGMLLGHEEKHTIVHSTQSNGILQHDTYSWEIMGSRFVQLETVTNSSRFVDYTLKEWIANMDGAQREEFVDTVYLVLNETNAKTLKEISENWFVSAKAVLHSVKNLDESTRKAVTATLILLMKCAKKGITQVLQSESARRE